MKPLISDEFAAFSDGTGEVKSRLVGGQSSSDCTEDSSGAVDGIAVFIALVVVVAIDIPPSLNDMQGFSQDL